MAILITGGAGFIGSHVCEALVERGEEVICFDNLEPYYDPKVKEQNISGLMDKENFTFVQGDIINFDEVKDVFATHKIRKIIHLAAQVGVRNSLEHPVAYIDTNLKGTIHLLELAKDGKVENFVFGSSSSVYGKSEVFPLVESDPANDPLSPYAATKKSGELLCQSYHNMYGLPVTCLRFFTVYGPRGRPDMAPYKFTKLISIGKSIEMYGDGSSKRDYTYVDDIKGGILKALDANLDFAVVNLGASKTITLKDFIRLIEDIVGKKATIKKLPMQPGDVFETYADVTLAKNLLGYEPKVDIKQGMQQFVDWFQNHE